MKRTSNFANTPEVTWPSPEIARCWNSNVDPGSGVFMNPMGWTRAFRIADC
jgi:hypothetical protein